VAKLEELSPHIVDCHVNVDVPHRHRRHGEHYAVRIDVLVPGRRLMVTRDPAQNANRGDLYATIDETFGEAARQLREYLRRGRHDERQSAAP
jgi:ribosome-associated translation inhibitor RaiA